MANQLNRTQMGSGIHVSSVRDAKFKHNRLTANFILPLSAESASNHAVVPFVLRKGFRECPDFTSLNARLAELYGAHLDADVTKYGGWQILEISVRALDNRFALEQEDITAQIAELLASIVLDPKLESGVLDAQDVALERQYLMDTIEAQINDKRSYALSRCVQTMCAGEPVAVRRLGTMETAQAVTPESAWSAYQRMVEQAQVEVLFTGSGDPAAAARIFTERFSAVRRAPLTLPPLNLRTKAEQVREEVERMELSQSKLVMGFRTGTCESRRDINARRVFSALFGGTPFSKLFINVREKLSLCYYCASRFNVSTGLLMVDSGIESANREKAQEEILRQLEAMQKGDFTEEEMHNAKLLMKNSVITAEDSLTGLEGWYMSQILRGQDITPAQDCREIDEITRDEVVKAAQDISLDTVYFLTGNQGHDGEGR